MVLLYHRARDERDGGRMDIEELSLKAHSLLRRAGLAELPRPVLVGVAIIAVGLMLLAIWNFWPKPNADFVATAASPSQEASAVVSGTPADTQVASDIVVDVEGAVNAPGLYSLPAEARVGDAIQAAGGLAPSAQPGAANLAQKLSDGEQVIIPTIEEAQESAPESSTAGSTSSKKDAKININTASAEELQELSGVGPALSERIVDYRESKGCFGSIEDLKNVSGIGETRFENLKDKIRV